MPRVAAAVRREPWLTRIESWNFVMSLVALAILVALFAPIASPARIAVFDQMDRLISGKIAAAKFDFSYLRWEGGRYGREALTALAASKDGHTRRMATYVLQQTNRYASLSVASPSFVGRLTVYPSGQTLPQGFARMDWNKEGRVWMRPNCPAAGACDAIIADLDGDGRPEVAIIADPGNLAEVFREGADGIWSQAGSFQMPFNCPAALDAVRQGRFKVQPPNRWNDLELGSLRLHVQEMSEREAPPKCPA